MNFDLKCSWLGATLVIQGRLFFFFLIFRVGGGEMRQYGCDPHNTQSALRDYKHEFTGKILFKKKKNTITVWHFPLQDNRTVV